ncbi:MAG TPA: pilus assembly protein PilP [Polyangiaceae bacterium]|nr:pilus assembly protein PilP [Polyangiaceae bacterium]
MSARYFGLFSLWIFGCSSPPVVNAGQTVSSAATTAAPGALGAPVPSASASAATSDLSPPPKVEIQENEFTESERSRDPFRSFASKFIEESKAHVHSQREVVLGQYSLDELKLIGIVTRLEPAKAMLVDPTGKGFVIQRGQFIGRPDVVQGAGQSGTTYEINWRVDRIRPSDVVLVREDPSNPDVPSATRVIPLRPEEAEGEGITEAKK